MSTVTVKIPPAFYDDHVARDLPAGTEIHRTLKVVTVELTVAELNELRSDAQHYADSAEEFWQDYRGAVISARATLRALEGVAVPEASTDHTERIRLAKGEAKAIKAWTTGGETGPRPATPNLDAIEVASAERAANGGKRPPAQRKLREVAPGTELPSGHLAPGALAAGIAEHVTSHGDVDHSVGEVAKAMGGKSAGAVRNALDRMVEQGAATLTCEKPRRYQAVPVAAAGAA